MCIQFNMKITFDPVKREKTLRERQLDFRDAFVVFKGKLYKFEDARKDYGEKRMIAVGYLADRMVIIGYVQRGDVRHIFSMRKVNKRETKKYKEQFRGS